MRIRIHRGTKEIGGTCIEVEAQGKRIALDVGLPLDAPDEGHERLLPMVPGFREPDGSLLGDSTGDNADKVDFCDECHSAVADNDRLFYVPEEFRRRMLGTVPSRTR